MNKQTVEHLLDAMDVERKRKHPPEGFPNLPDIPAGRYRDADFLRTEKKFLWRKSWLYAGHVDEFAAPGSFKLWQRTGAPILILKDKSDDIRAFYNACRHRGGPLVMCETGQLDGGITCRYHGWTYDLDGQLVNLREKRDFSNLDRSERGLNPVRCERLGNWIFINEDPGAPALEEELGPLFEYFTALPLNNLRLVDQQTFVVRCHWKILLDSFLEVYHLKSLHPGTVDRFLDYRGTHIILWRHGHSLMLSPNRRDDWVDPGAKGMPEMDNATEIERNNSPSLLCYPNLVTPVAATGLPFNMIWPQTDGSTLLEVAWFAPGESDEGFDDRWKKRLDNYNRILGEDIEFLEHMQSSIESEGFRGASLGYQERRIYHWHEELDRRIGTKHIAENLRIDPVLQDFVRDGWT